MIPETVAIAIRLHPGNLALIQVDGGHARVGRFEQRQPLGHGGLSPATKRALGELHRAADRFIWRIEMQHREAIVRWHVEDAGFWVHAGATPVRAAVDRRTLNGAG